MHELFFLRRIQPSSDKKVVQWLKYQPSFARFLDIADDDRHETAVTLLGLAADGMPEFVQTFLAWPECILFKLIAFKCHALSGLSCIFQICFVHV